MPSKKAKIKELQDAFEVAAKDMKGLTIDPRLIEKVSGGDGLAPEKRVKHLLIRQGDQLRKGQPSFDNFLGYEVSDFYKVEAIFAQCAEQEEEVRLARIEQDETRRLEKEISHGYAWSTPHKICLEPMGQEPSEVWSGCGVEAYYDSEFERMKEFCMLTEDIKRRNQKPLKAKGAANATSAPSTNMFEVEENVERRAPPGAIKKLKAMFLELDTDGNGTLDPEEFWVLYKREIEHNRQRSDQHFEEWDLNNDMEMDFNEFVQFMLARTVTKSDWKKQDLFTVEAPEPGSFRACKQTVVGICSFLCCWCFVKEAVVCIWEVSKPIHPGHHARSICFQCCPKGVEWAEEKRAKAIEPDEETVARDPLHGGLRRSSWINRQTRGKHAIGAYAPASGRMKRG
jgi:hypothetical protein